MPVSRASSLNYGVGIWTTSNRIEYEAEPLIEMNIGGLWHLPYLGNSVAAGTNFSWKADIESDLAFMVFSLEAEGRYYISPYLPYWVGLRASPTLYLRTYAGASDTLSLLGYIDVGVSYPLGTLGLELRGTFFLAGDDTVGYGLTINYAFLKGR